MVTAHRDFISHYYTGGGIPECAMIGSNLRLFRPPTSYLSLRHNTSHDIGVDQTPDSFVGPDVAEWYHSSIHRRNGTAHWQGTAHWHQVGKPVPSRERKHRHRHGQQSASNSWPIRVKVLRLPHKQLPTRVRHDRQKMRTVHVPFWHSHECSHRGLGPHKGSGLCTVRHRDLAQRGQSV